MKDFPKNLYAVIEGEGSKGSKDQFVATYETLDEIAEIGVEKMVGVYHLSTKLTVTADARTIASHPVESKAEVKRIP